MIADGDQLHVEVRPEPLPAKLEVLEHFRRDGRAWVSTSPNDRPVAYLIADMVDDCAHIEQVSVDPVFSRRGIGRSLIDHAAVWAAGRGLRVVTLTINRGKKNAR